MYTEGLTLNPAGFFFSDSARNGSARHARLVRDGRS